MQQVDQQRALQAAIEAHLLRLMSEPLSLTKLARLHKQSRNRNFRLYVEAIPGVVPVQLGKHKRYLVPIIKLPLAYYSGTGFEKLLERPC